MPPPPGRAAIVIAEDAAIMREGSPRSSPAAAMTCRRGGRRRALRQAVDAHRPDVAIIDVRMPPTHTDEGLRAARPSTVTTRVGVLVFSQYIETQRPPSCFAGAPGGVGYLLKDRVADVSDFIDAISRVARAARCSIPKWSASCSAPAAGPTRWPRSPRGNARCSRSSPRAGPTPPSPTR